MKKCFACDKRLGSKPAIVDTRDDQTVFVGSECYKKIKAAGEKGYKPAGCMRLWTLNADGRGLTEHDVALMRTKINTLQFELDYLRDCYLQAQLLIIEKENK